jgi:hypothetical protein
VIAITVQNNFYLEIHQNDISLFFKNYFWDQHIKTIQKYKKKLIFNNKIIFLESRVSLVFISSHVDVEINGKLTMT